MRRISLTLAVSILIAVACTPQPTPNVDATVRAAVSATRDSVPIATPMAAPTGTSYPTLTPYPTSTPLPTHTPYPTPTAVPSRTPTETPKPKPTDAPAPAQAPVPPAPRSSGAMLLETIRTVRVSLNDYGGCLSRAGQSAWFEPEPIDCRELVPLYDTVAAAPELSLPADDPVLLWAYDRYRKAIAVFVDSARDLTGHCRELISGTAGTDEASHLAFGRAGGGVNRANDLFHEAITKLEEEGY